MVFRDAGRQHQSRVDARAPGHEPVPPPSPAGRPGAHTGGVIEHPLVAAAAFVGVSDPRVLDAVASVARADFVPPELAVEAERDRPIPIPHGQVTTQPSLVATMVEALTLTGPERVLEIGTGYGWQSALLSRLAAEVWSIERWDDLAASARMHLARLGATNVAVVVGDGSEGLPEHAPYDAILVSAAFPRVPPPLIAQLAERGRLVQPIGRGGDEDVVLFRTQDEALRRVRTVAGARFVPLVGRHGQLDRICERRRFEALLGHGSVLVARRLGISHSRVRVSEAALGAGCGSRVIFQLLSDEHWLARPGDGRMQVILQS
jgi:protein-L-isoaspartate(D-aspartate) O-methyltransferase